MEVEKCKGACRKTAFVYKDDAVLSGLKERLEFILVALQNISFDF